MVPTSWLREGRWMLKTLPGIDASIGGLPQQPQLGHGRATRAG
jgi:hypothetical protein